MPAETRIVLRNIDKPNSEHIAVYQSGGGYQALRKALKDMLPVEVIDLIKNSGLRGRGGAGFPTGMKWQFCSADHKKPKYIICNADEGEPGTFKDRDILERDPHAVLEGMAVAGFAIGAEYGTVYIRGEYLLGVKRLLDAIWEAEAKGFLGKNILGSDFSFDINIYSGAGSYICGEETALLESLEGKVGRSRLKPPFPVNEGFWAKPTSVNNVETLANVPLIVANGDEWFKGYGLPDCSGTKIFSISGHVNRPGNYELPMGVTLRELIYDFAGGIRENRKPKAVLPGGTSTSCLIPDQFDIKMDFRSLSLAGTMLGSGAVIVMDETTCMVGAALSVAEFFAHESCGRCTPCREGTMWMVKLLERVRRGQTQNGELDLIRDLGENMRIGSFCPLGKVAHSAAVSFLDNFPEEFQNHAQYCPKGDH